MNELPNTVGDQSAFWARQRSLPHGPERPEQDTRPIPLWKIVSTFALVAGLAAVALSI